MSLLRGLALFFIAASLQWAWSTYFSFFGLAPQLLLVLAVVAATERGAITSMGFGFMWGLFLDIFEPRLFGSNALAMTLVGYGAGLARRQIDVAALAPMALLVIHATWGYFLLKSLLGLVFARSFSWVGWSGFMLDPLYNCLVLPALAALWRGIMGGKRQ